MTQQAGPAARTGLFGETIFSEMTALAAQHRAVNLGQGFPDFAPPEFVLEACHRAVRQSHHQYARSPGDPALCTALARLLEPEFGRPLDPMAEITVTVGATEGLFSTFHALLDPGDEVILLEPFYDAYPADVALAGGVPRYVPLHPRADGRWEFDPGELRRAFSPRTKLLVLNTPHNPTGKVFTPEELELCAALCLEHDALVLCDEVYDRMTFDGLPHRRLAAIEGMWPRTITLGSAGKTFSVTGWKVGWAVAPPQLSLALRRIHQWVTFAVATPLQQAVAQCLEQAPEQDYFAWLARMYQDKRDRLVAALQRTPLRPLTPEGTYFVMAQSGALGFDGDDADLCRHLVREAGIAAIPPSAFYCDEHRHLARELIRFCFCKDDATLSAAAAALDRAYPIKSE